MGDKNHEKTVIFVFLSLFHGFYEIEQGFSGPKLRANGTGNTENTENTENHENVKNGKITKNQS